jgi:hypothetical protein
MSLPLLKVDDWGVVWKGASRGISDDKGVIWDASWTKTSIWPGDWLTYDDGDDNVGVFVRGLGFVGARKKMKFEIWQWCQGCYHHKHGFGSLE